MPGQLLNSAWRAVLGQIGRAGAQAAATFEQLARDQRRVARLADLDGNVDALLQRIDITRGQLHLRTDLRVLAHEFAQHPAQKQLAKPDGRADPQQAGRRLLQLHHRLLGLGEVEHDLPAALVIGLPHLGQAQLARGAVEQAHAQPCLQLLHQLGDAGLAHVQGVGGLGEAAAVHHTGKGLHRIETVHRDSGLFGFYKQ